MFKIMSIVSMENSLKCKKELLLDPDDPNALQMQSYPL